MIFKCLAILLLSTTTKTVSLHSKCILGKKNPKPPSLQVAFCSVCFVISFPTKVWWLSIFGLSHCFISQIQDLHRISCEPKALVAHLVQHLACEQKRQNDFNGKGERRNQTELLAKRGKNLCTNVLLKWGKGWSEVPTESQSWGRGTPNDS